MVGDTGMGIQRHMPIPILYPQSVKNKGDDGHRPPCSRYGSVVRLSSGSQVLKVRHDLVIYPADPVIAKSDPLGPLPGLLQPQDMLT